MTDTPKTPKLTPDGKATQERQDTDETQRSSVGEVQDPQLPGDADENRPFANTDEAVPDKDGLVRDGDNRAQPLI